MVNIHRTHGKRNIAEEITWFLLDSNENKKKGNGHALVVLFFHSIHVYCDLWSNGSTALQCKMQPCHSRFVIKPFLQFVQIHSVDV